MASSEHINDCIRKIEWEEGVRVLYACEAGSRAWGFASEGSDHDVRFVYARPVGEYLRLSQPKDTISRPLTREMDINGWDVRKFLSLMRKSNPSAYEWLGSPIVYREDSGWDYVREASWNCFSPLASTWHYIGATHSTLRLIANGNTRPKKYLHAIRSILAARWSVVRKVPVPVMFDELWDELPQPEIADKVAFLLETKRNSPENESIGRDDELLAWCYDHMNDLKRSAHDMHDRGKCDWALLDDAFRRAVGI